MDKNPTDTTDLQQQFGTWLDDFQSSNQTPDYPSQPDSISDQISALPNSDKLTNTEKWLYEKLPGVSQSKTMQAITAFTEYEPVAKVLGVLDVFAEGAERTLGLIAQYRDMEEGDEFRLKDAWAAGSLFWDTVRLPKIGRDEEGRFGIQIEDGLPGAYAVTEARKLLEEGKSMDEVRGLLYDKLGALSLRSQLQDTLGHVIVDPLTPLLGMVKPVQRLHAVRNLALTGKMDVNAMQAMETVARVAGDIKKADQIAGAIELANKSGKAITKLDRFAIMITGGTPYLKKAEQGYELMDVAKLSKTEKVLQKLNPFALTPQARASELLDVVAAIVGEQLIRPLWHSDPEEFIKAMGGAARGAIGEQWGHLAATIQGRTVQAVLSQADAAVKTIGKEWTIYTKERNVLARLAGLIDNTDERKIWQMAKKNSKNLWETVVRSAKEKGDADLLKAIQDGQLTPKMMDDIGKIDNFIPLMREEFYTKSLVTIQDVAMRQSILLFGITEKGLLTKWSDALKAWETLPFIKANPANMIRNIVNNDITLIGRGLFGTMMPSQLRNFWKGKHIPQQFRRGFGLTGNEFGSAGELAKHDELFDPGNAIKALEETLNGKSGLADKVKEAANVDLKV